jgi:hypothetical protein
LKEIIVIEPHYLPVIRYFTYLSHAKRCIIDDMSLFEKQSFRNRTRICGANGPLTLVVPLKQGKTRQKYKEVKIDYSSNWQHIHWTTLFSAYNNSPFFEHYAELFEKYYFRRFNYLLDFNLSLIQEVCRALQLDTIIEILSEQQLPDTYQDYRKHIHPKAKYHIEDANYQEQSYLQVFAEKFGYQPNMSSIDLLFCEGPQAENILLSNLKK